MPDKTFALSRPIKGHGKAGAEEIKEITLREPIADDVFDLESPTTQIATTDGRHVEVKLNGRALRAWLSRLSGLDGGVLGAVASRDLNEMAQWLNMELNAAKN